MPRTRKPTELELLRAEMAKLRAQIAAQQPVRAAAKQPTYAHGATADGGPKWSDMSRTERLAAGGYACSLDESCTAVVRSEKRAGIHGVADGHAFTTR